MNNLDSQVRDYDRKLNDANQTISNLRSSDRESQAKIQKL